MVLFGGCVQCVYTKTVQVTKDAKGEITGSIETETVTEPHQETKRISEAPSMDFKYLGK